MDKMDQMLPSPGFSIPSVGTPLHQPEEDQQIIGNNPYYTPQHIGSQHGMMSSSMMGASGNSLNSGMGGPPSVLSGMGLPPLMNTPTKLSSYQPSYATPQSMMQPQTPVHTNLNLFLIYYAAVFTYTC